MATGTGTLTRSRSVSEAARTMREWGALTTHCLLARVPPWSRKKLPTEASKVEPPVHARARVEPPAIRLAGPGNPLMGRASALQFTPIPLVASEATCRARRTGRTYSDTTTLPTRTWEPCAALPWERASLRLSPRMGQSLRSSPRWEQTHYMAKGGSWVNKDQSELSRRKDV